MANANAVGGGAALGNDAAARSGQSEICLSCDDSPAVSNGFCAGCAAFIEGDIWMEDIAPRRAMTGKILYAGDPLPDRFA